MAINDMENDDNVLLNTFCELSSDAIIFINKSGVIIFFNKIIQELLCWKKSNVLKKNFESLYLNDKSITPFPIEFYKKCVKEDRCVFGQPIPCKDIYITWRVKRINSINLKGHLIVGHIQNTFFKGTTIQNQLERISSCIPGNFYWKNKNAQYEGCNQTLLNTLGLKSMYDLVGKTDYDLWPAQASELKKNDELVMSSSAPIFFEETVILPGKEKMYFSVIKMPLLDDRGNVIGILGNSLDITELKKTQYELNVAKIKAESASKAKTEFIANMSHDIRTPLTGVIGLSTILEQDLQNETDKEKAHLLHDSGEQLLHMLNDILDDVSAEHLDKEDITEESFDVHECINDLIRLETPATSLKHLILKTDIAPNVPRYICSDHNKIYRILLNFLGNAIKFTESGSITLSIECLHKDNSAVHLKFGVSDTGIGIPEEVQSQVFNRFFKVSSSYKGVYSGHGLGLHIAQSYVNLLGGHITLTSQLGHGSTFNFDLECPLGEVYQHHTDRTLTSLTSPIATNSMQKKTHLLLVEDNLIALKTLEMMLSNKGYTFISATTGEDAWMMFQTNYVDLIITDIGLPGISGTELTQMIRKHEKDTGKHPVPILGLTGHAKKATWEECQLAGMNDILSKPAQIETIDEIVKKCINAALSQKNNFINQSASSSLGIDLPNTEQELFQLDDFPLFDEKLALEQVPDKDLLISLLHTYISDEIQKDITQMSFEYQQGNWDKIEQLAHKTKGGVTYLGTQKMRYACQYLERYYKAGHLLLLDPLYQQLIKVNEETLEELKRWLNCKM